MKLKMLFALSLALFAIGPAIADDAADRAAVVELVGVFFEQMKNRDTAGMRSLLTPDGIFYGYRETTDGLEIARPTHASFIEGIGQGDSELVERFWEPKVLLHDRMAVVWTPYDLYVNGEFSHCGIDSFNFLKTDDGWKITGIVFSMETENCGESPLGPLEQ